MTARRILKRNSKLRVFLYFILFLTLSVIFHMIKFKERVNETVELTLEEKLKIVDEYDSEHYLDIIPFVKRNDSEKVDWHDYEQTTVEVFDQDMYRSLLNLEKLIDEKTMLLSQSYKMNGYNGDLSDELPLNRMLPDTRYEQCKTMLYDEHLPSVSVIICFHNEHWSTLLRTLHSIFDRSPQHLLKELILVDDASTSSDFLKNKFSDYIRIVLPKARLIRLEKRSGLIHARLNGAKNATGDMLLFMDPHCEVNVNWLPPLLDFVGNDYKKVVCPLIDIINATTFEYKTEDNGRRGVFDWRLNYHRVPLFREDEKSLPEPFKTPVMAGMVFAISRYFFWMLGGYDEGLTLSGGENLELSFKIWLSGGSLYEVPCSRVGHVYRNFQPKHLQTSGKHIWKNYKRIADVWMDSYAKLVYNEFVGHYVADIGDLTKAKTKRRILRCHTFKWFMTFVAVDIPHIFPPLQEPVIGLGQIRNHFQKFCIDAMDGFNGDNVYLKQCNRTKGEQIFVFGWSRMIRLKSRNVCLDGVEGEKPVKIMACERRLGQMWMYDFNTMQMVHNGFCLDIKMDKFDDSVYVKKCDPLCATQKWEFSYFDYKLYKTRNEFFRKSFL